MIDDFWSQPRAIGYGRLLYLLSYWGDWLNHAA